MSVNLFEITQEFEENFVEAAFISMKKQENIWRLRNNELNKLIY